MLLRLVVLFCLVPLLELLLLVEVGRLVGLLPTIVMVLATGVLGAWLARREGLRTVTRLREELASGALPGQTLLDGALILVAGAVLLTPGFITDAVGFGLLIPAGRSLVRRRLSAWLRRRTVPGEEPVVEARWERMP